MEIIKNNKIIVRKEDASKKVFKGVSLDSLAALDGGRTQTGNQQP